MLSSAQDNNIAQLTLAGKPASVPNITLGRQTKHDMLELVIGRCWAQDIGSAAAAAADSVAAAQGVEAGAAAKGPLVAVAGGAPLEETKAVGAGAAVLLIVGLWAVTELNVLVLPAGTLLQLGARKPPDARDVVGDSSHETTTNKINGVVMVEVHGGPPDPANVEDEEVLELGEAVLHEEGLENGIGTVQAGEGTERQGSGGEAGGVHVDAEKLVNAGETGGRTLHAVVSRLQTVRLLVPGRSAGEDQLNGDGEHAHVAESTSKHGGGAGRGKEEEDGAADSGERKVADTIGEPGKQIEDGVAVGRENVGQVGSVKDVLERREDLDPDVRTVLGGNKSARAGLLVFVFIGPTGAL